MLTKIISFFCLDAQFWNHVKFLHIFLFFILFAFFYMIFYTQKSWIEWD